MSQLLWECTRERVHELAPRAVLVIPVGSVEQHGPHLPLGVDSMVVEHLASVAAGQAERTTGRPHLVSPVITTGSSHHHLPYSGTLSVRSSVLLDLLADLGESAVRGGLRRVFFLNGHGGNDAIVQQAARDLALHHDVLAAAGSYWTLAARQLAEVAAPLDGALVPGHAGGFETAVMLALRPELVGEYRPRTVGGIDAAAPAGLVVERHEWVQRCGGATDDAHAATAEVGAALLKAAVAGVSAALVHVASLDLAAAEHVAA